MLRNFLCVAVKILEINSGYNYWTNIPLCYASNKPKVIEAKQLWVESINFKFVHIQC